VFAAVGLLVATAGFASGAQKHKAPRGKKGVPAASALKMSQPPIDDDQHGGPDGHLPGLIRNVKLVSRLRLTDTQSGVADVHYYKGHAYVAKWAPECPNGGVDIVNVRNPNRPRKVGFLPAGPDDYVGEGVHAIHIKNRMFEGDVLLVNHEACGDNFQEGISLWDITDPRNPFPLALHTGDFTGGIDPEGANSVHSVMGFTQNNQRNAYAVLVDNEESGSFDVDIMDITNPGRPVMIRETGQPDWPGLNVDGHGQNSFHHDMWFKRIGGHDILGVNYWDGGFVFLNVDDPANPVFLRDTDYPEQDILGNSPPEGNGHQGEWSRDGKYWLGGDEDFSPFRSIFEVLTGPNAGEYPGAEFGWTVPIALNFEEDKAEGTTVYGGTACPTDVNGNGTPDSDEVPDASDYDAQYSPGEERILVVTRGVCFFSEKVEAGQNKGWDMVIVGNHHAGSSHGEFPDAYLCGGQGHNFDVQASGGCTGHRAMHLVFNDTAEYTPEGAPLYPGADLNDKIGAVGEDIRLTSQFDGWGYLNLYNYRTNTFIDEYAPPPTIARDKAFGFGILSMHEIETDRRKSHSDLGYLAWYGVGVKVVKWNDNGIRSLGTYRHAAGNDFWGVSLQKRGKRRPLIYMSDRDSGLWVFKYTGRQ
jgi:hypothetical protein